MTDQEKMELATKVSETWDQWRDANEFDSSTDIPKEVLEGIFYAIGFLNDECMVYQPGWIKIQNSLEFLLKGNSDDE
jgi:hypothetical protein